jgi:thymidylate synthase (FAD)
MKVVLLAHTPDPEGVVYAAARGCYSDLPSYEIRDRGVELPTAKKFIRGIIKSGHESVLEHVSFTFSVEGISRACSHQLVRHRVASYSQQSQRYVDFGDEESIIRDMFVIPPAIDDDFYSEEILADTLRICLLNYKELVRRLISIGRTSEQAHEDARYLLPNAAKTNITVTMNAREIRHFINQRECKRAQWEIRDLASAMLIICLGVSEDLFWDSGASCRRGPCKEGKMTCGDPYPMISLV